MILTVLIWAVLAVVVILAALILTPVRLHVHASTAPILKYRAEVRLLGGMAPPFAIADSAWPRKPRARKRKTKKVRKKPGTRLAGGAGKASAVFELIIGLLREIHLEHFKLDAEFGLLDPADTGQLYGSLTSFQFGAPHPENAYISVRPNFAKACFNGNIDVSLRFAVAAFLPPAVWFAWRIFGPAT